MGGDFAQRHPDHGHHREQDDEREHERDAEHDDDDDRDADCEGDYEDDIGTNTSMSISTNGSSAKAGNPAFPDAVRALETLFRDESGPGPVKSAHFVFGLPQATDSNDARTRRLPVQQDALDAGKMLAKAKRP